MCPISFSGFDRAIWVQTEILGCRPGALPKKHVPILPELCRTRSSCHRVWERGQSSHPDLSRYSGNLSLHAPNQKKVSRVLTMWVCLQWSLSMVWTPVWAVTMKSWNQLFTTRDSRSSDRDKAWKTHPGLVYTHTDAHGCICPRCSCQLICKKKFQMRNASNAISWHCLLGHNVGGTPFLGVWSESTPDSS